MATDAGGLCTELNTNISWSDTFTVFGTVDGKEPQVSIGAVSNSFIKIDKDHFDNLSLILLKEARHKHSIISGLYYHT